MPKHKRHKGNQGSSLQATLEVGRGEIQDNALKAVVTSPLFKVRVEKAKKGKGSFCRKMKHKGKSPIQKPLR